MWREHGKYSIPASFDLRRYTRERERVRETLNLDPPNPRIPNTSALPPIYYLPNDLSFAHHPRVALCVPLGSEISGRCRAPRYSDIGSPVACFFFPPRTVILNDGCIKTARQMRFDRDKLFLYLSRERRADPTNQFILKVFSSEN